MVRVVLVDDQRVFRHNLALALDADSGIHIVGEARSGVEAVRVVADVRPEVVLMDIRMPGGDGIWACRTLSSQSIPVRVVLMTAFDTEQTFDQAFEAGASGYLLKHGGSRMMAEAIRTAARGHAVVSPEILRRLLDRRSRTRPRPGDASIETLTATEFRVVQALCTGAADDRAIARRLSLQPATVNGHIKHVLRKLELGSRAELVAWCFRNGVVS